MESREEANEFVDVEDEGCEGQFDVVVLEMEVVKRGLFLEVELLVGPE